MRKQCIKKNAQETGNSTDNHSVSQDPAGSASLPRQGAQEKQGGAPQGAAAVGADRSVGCGVGHACQQRQRFVAGHHVGGQHAAADVVAHVAVHQPESCQGGGAGAGSRTIAEWGLPMQGSSAAAVPCGSSAVRSQHSAAHLRSACRTPRCTRCLPAWPAGQPGGRCCTIAGGGGTRGEGIAVGNGRR